MNSKLDTDAQFLKRAARLALRGHGSVEPNPMVGCVVVNHDGKIVGEGFHPRFGEAHAETIALASAGDSARGATVYVTLEPCGHQGQSPPCTNQLIRHQVAKVVIGSRDPFPPAAGGIKILNDAGIQTVLRDDIEELRTLNAPFLHRITTKRPWVVAKWAQTLDGAIATSGGDSKWISGPQSRSMVHRERGRCDAILCGIGTVIADNPMLNARGVRKRRTALRVVYDFNLEIPLDSNLVHTAGDPPVLIGCSANCADTPKAQELRKNGIEVLSLSSKEPLTELLENLYEHHSVSTVLVEAGGGLLGSLLESQLINAALVFTAPRILGEKDAPRAFRGLTPTSMADAKDVHVIWSGVRGEDIAAWYHFPST